MGSKWEEGREVALWECGGAGSGASSACTDGGARVAGCRLEMALGWWSAGTGTDRYRYRYFYVELLDLVKLSYLVLLCTQ